MIKEVSSQGLEVTCFHIDNDCIFQTLHIPNTAFIYFLHHQNSFFGQILFLIVLQENSLVFTVNLEYSCNYIFVEHSLPWMRWLGHRIYGDTREAAVEKYWIFCFLHTHTLLPLACARAIMNLFFSFFFNSRFQFSFHLAYYF